MVRSYPVYPDLDIASRHSKLLDILSVLVAETGNPSDEDEGAVGVKVSSNFDEHGTTKISVAPNDPNDVVKDDVEYRTPAPSKRT